MRFAWRGLASFIGSAIWWIVDRLYGDAIFARVRPMIPGWISDLALEEIITWGPAIALILLGSYFFWQARGQRSRPAVVEGTVGGTSAKAPTQKTSRFPNGLYVSDMLFQMSRLSRDSAVHITVTAFNGTGEDIILKTISGNIVLEGGTVAGRNVMGKLVTPNFYGLAHTSVESDRVFTFTIEQPLHRKLAERFKKWEDGASFALDFEKLHVVVQSSSDRTKTTPLPLWEAMVITRKGGELRKSQRGFLRPGRPFGPFKSMSRYS